MEQADDERSTRLQRNGTGHTRALGAKPLHTDHDNAGHVRGRGQAKQDGDKRKSQNEVGRVHAGRHDIRNGVHNKRDRQRDRRFRDARLHVHVQSDM